MLLDATYSSKASGRSIGRDVEYQQARHPLLRAFGLRGKKRSKIQFEPISFATARATLDRLLPEDGLFILQLADGRSSVDFADSGDHVTFFIEQYFDSLYGGVYDASAASCIVETIFQGCSSEQLSDLFSQLPGELIYDYHPKVA
jgi:hypothetical protein